MLREVRRASPHEALPEFPVSCPKCHGQVPAGSWVGGWPGLTQFSIHRLAWVEDGLEEEVDLELEAVNLFSPVMVSERSHVHFGLV